VDQCAGVEAGNCVGAARGAGIVGSGVALWGTGVAAGAAAGVATVPAAGIVGTGGIAGRGADAAVLLGGAEANAEAGSTL